MPGSGKNSILAFDQFRLDVGRLMLYRGEEEISIAPKIVKTLAVLVENAGTIIPKDELIESVWADSIVEEANLTQYLYLLRKTLGAMPDGRPYIETLRRRGYRFNGKVERLTESKVSESVTRRDADLPAFGVEREGNVLRVVDWQTQDTASGQPEPETNAVVSAAAGDSRRPSSIPRFAVVVLFLLVAAGGTVIFLWPRLMPAATNAEAKKEISVVKLTNGPVPGGATISPDGNLFVYHEIDGETWRMYVQQTGQSSRIEIASSSDKTYGPKTFSPDGQSIYYIAGDKKTSFVAIYKMPAIGGAPVKVLDNAHGPVSFSPDGKEFAFSRYNAGTSDSSIVIVGSDGRGERVLLHRKAPHGIAPSVSWSPDGRRIAFGERSFGEGRGYDLYRLNVVDIASARVTHISEEKWDNILRVVWAPDGAGLVMNATRENEGHSTRRDQIYFVSYPGGVSQRLTNDGNRYEYDSLGITRKGEVLAVSGSRSSQVWVMDPEGDSASAVQLTKGASDGRAGLAPLPDGSFGYLARNVDEISIMVANPDASETRQLPTGHQYIEELRADPLGRFFVFSVLKDRRSYLFRVDIDSGVVKQLTFGERAIDSTVSPDGKFLVYDLGRYENDVEILSLMRIPIEGGEPMTLKPKGCFLPTYSPDGSLLSCVDYEKGGIVIVSAADGMEIERHPLPVFATWNFGIGWTRDGSGLIYIVTEKGTSNLWVQPRDGTKPRRLTNFTSGVIYRYAFAPDGSKLFVARGYPVQDAVLIRNYR